jgi:hypothetical protein
MVHRRRRFSHIADIQCRTVSPISIAVLQCCRFSPSPLFTLRIFISSRNTFTNPNSLYRDFISFTSRFIYHWTFCFMYCFCVDFWFAIHHFVQFVIHQLVQFAIHQVLLICDSSDCVLFLFFFLWLSIIELILMC